ncbi:uncharacterized protein C20orf96 homolog [Saccopteryx bilineata]|uniref:uncharacterized protein C20orf96 homolog n=1 Tax=Saccopteryx bilineata TaxID=59482 RepID=UPI00338D9410
MLRRGSWRRPGYGGSPSTTRRFQNLDYVPRQWSKQKIEPPTLLPALQTSGPKKSKMNTNINFQPESPKPATLMTGRPKSPRELHGGRKDSGKTKLQLMRTMLWNRQSSLQELRNQKGFLTKLNEELIKTIQDTEDSAALKTRRILQQQHIFGTIIHILAHSNERKLQQMTGELQEWKKKEESKMSYLKQQVEQLNAKIKKIQKEVNFLSTYMNQEYPARSVQIASLAHQLQQLQDHQQDELDGFSTARRMALESLSDQIQAKRKQVLSSLVEKTQRPHQGFLLQKTWANRSLAERRDKFREFTSQVEEEIPALRAEVEQLQRQVREPREVVFADILLRRPKCTPDMDVTLNIPVEEPLPF